MKSLVNSLKTISAFAELSDADLSILGKICSAAEWPADTVITQEGYTGDSIFALTSGTVDIWVDYGTDHADLLAVRRAPTLVGEMSVADKLPDRKSVV